MQQSNTDKLFTNSCIQLSIPFQYQQYGGILCHWTSTPTNNNKPNDLFQFLTSKQRTPKDFERTYYLCSPLDVGSSISVKVQQERPMQNTILENLKYGIVQVEDSLAEVAQNPKHNRIELLLNKNVRKQATIHIIHERTPNSFVISIVMANSQIKLPISDRIAKNQLQTFQKFPYFKIYDSEPNTVGLLISYVMPYLMQKLREMNIFYHFGNYLKIYFQNRACRDLFMLHLISHTESGIQSLTNLRQLLHQIENTKNKKITHDNVAGQTQKNAPRQLMKIPKIQSTVRASQIMSPGLRSAEEGESEEQFVQEDILEDIYNILYTPANKIGKQSKNVSTTVGENTEVKNLQSSNSNLLNLKSMGKIVEAERQQKSIQIYESQQFEYQIPQQASPKQKPNKNQQAQNRYSQHEASSRYPIKKYKTLQYELQGKNKQSRKQLYGTDKPNLQLKVHNDFSKEIREIDLLEKINQLIRKNQVLVHENASLRSENEKLKATQNKSDKFRQLNKMIQIKAMVQMMAHKLQELESANPSHENTKNGFQHKTVKQQSSINQFLRKRQKQQNQQSTKRIWSPRTHHQLIKNIKQKHHQQKGIERKPSGVQISNPRKKSLSNEQSQFKEHHNYNIGSMKQCVTFGRSNGYIFNIQDKLKTDLSQTTQLKQVGKKNKQTLFTSIRDLQYHDSSKNGQKQQTNSEPSTLQPTFRNVFG